MIYAIIGIPIGLVMFNSIGERFNYFSSMIINKFRKMVKAQQPETTELDLICVGLTLSGIVFTSGAAAFSHYEGKTTIKVMVIIYRISSYSFRGNYSFLNLEIQRSQYIRPKVTVHKGAETIQGRKLFKGGNYMRKYGIF